MAEFDLNLFESLETTNKRKPLQDLEDNQIKRIKTSHDNISELSNEGKY